MPTTHDVQDWSGRHLVGPDGAKIGTIDGIYVDDHTGQPTWALVNTGLLHRTSSFAPITDAILRGDDVQVPFDKDTVRGAPGVDPDEHLTPEREEALYRYYGRTDYDTPQATNDTSHVADERPAQPPSPSGSIAPADDTMVLSEEQVEVTTRPLPATKVRMRKVTITEEVTLTVPVTREEIRLEEVPADAPDLDPSEIPDTDASGAAILHSEIPVVNTRSVESERVRMDKATVTEDLQVTETVRREQLDLEQTDTDDDQTRRPPA